MKPAWRSAGILCLVSSVGIIGMPAAWGIPSTINVSGYLVGPDLMGLEGTFDWALQFYETISGATPVGELQSGSVQIEAGLFNITISPPEAVLTRDEIWYSLAIDTDENGLDPEDRFADLFQLTSVPYALAAKPAAYYTPIGSSTCCGASYNAGDLIVCPFNTPPGGVTFDHMGAWFNASTNPGAATVICSFGIYDANGEAVALSGPVSIPKSFTGMKIVSVSARLLPSEIYYVGWGTDSNGQSGTLSTVNIGPGIQPAIPNFGHVENAVINGIIPSSFDPTLIVQRTSPGPDVPLAVTLYYEEPPE